MRESKISVILSIIAIVGVLSVWLLWLCGSLKLSVIGLDTFIGVIVALLAIIVTVILGWQIVNALEMRGKIEDLEKRQSSMLGVIDGMNKNTQNTIKMAYNLQVGLCDMNASLCEANGLLVYAFASLHSALDQAIKAGQGGLDKRIKNLERIGMMLVGNDPLLNNQIKQQILFESDSIRGSEAYRCYLSSVYEQVMNLFWSKF